MKTTAQSDPFGKASSRAEMLLPVVLCVAGLVAYAGSFQVPFYFDDDRCILQNPVIDSFWPIEVRSPLGRRRPIGHLTLAVNFALGGTNPIGYHVFNLAVHLLAGLALFGLVRRTLLLPRLQPTYGKSAARLAFAVALLWLLHPLLTQGVTYVIQRCESMVGMFYLACLYGTLRGSQSSRPWSWAWYAAAVVVYCIGMATKEMMTTAPLVVLLYDRVFLADSWKNLVRRRWGLYLAFLPGLVRMGMAIAPALSPKVRAASMGFGHHSITSWEYLSSQAGVILHYLRLAFWPDPLCLDYGWRVASTNMAIFLPGAVIVGLLLASLWALWRRPPIGFLGLAFFIILAPTSSFMPLSDLAFEHRMYLSLAAVVTLAVFGFHHLTGYLLQDDRTRMMLQRAVLIVVALALLAGTIRRNHQYNHPLEMWQEVVAIVPQNARAFTILATEYQKRGNLDEARKNLEHAIRLEQNALACHILANIYIELEETDQAVKFYQQALTVRPDFAESRLRLALLLEEQGKIDEAMAQVRRTIELKPKHAQAYAMLGLMMEDQEKLDEAAEQYRKAIRLHPRYAECYLQLGLLLQKQNDFQAAAEHIERSLEIDTKQNSVRVNLGLLYLQQNQLTKALAYFRDAFQREPDLLRQAGDLIWILAASEDEAQRNGREAVFFAEQRADLIGRNDPAALDLLSAAYAEVGRWDEALATARRAVDLARAAGLDTLVRQIEARLRLYEQRRPLRIPRTP